MLKDEVIYMRNEILRSIDNIANEESESLLNVSNAILNYYEKQQIVLENCDDIYAYEFPEDSRQDMECNKTILQNDCRFHQ